MKYKRYFIQVINKGDDEAVGLLENRLPKNGKSLKEFRRIQEAVELLFPRVEIKIISKEVSRKPVVRVL